MKDLQLTMDEYHAERFLIHWMNAHKPMQFLFSLVQKNRCWQVKRIKENRYLGLVDLTTGQFFLEIYKKNGEWMTDQKSLLPIAPLVKQPYSFPSATR